jgi:type VI secretion system secreted protein Hcp
MAATDFFLKIKGIPGESKDHKHKDEIHLESWSWGESQSGTHGSGGGGGAGKVSMQDFHFVMSVNKASPKLMLACATGEHIPEAILTCRKAGGTQNPFVTYTFTDLLISSYQTGGSGGSSVIPTDQISFNFTKLMFDYQEQDEKGNAGGKISAGYDLKAQKKL